MTSTKYMTFLARELPKLAARPLRRKLLRKRKRSDILNAALDRVAQQSKPGRCLEFGVHRGVTINRSTARLPGHTFAGFDSFEGFPDDGRSDLQQDFTVDSMPEVAENVTLVKGWFSDTLPPFLASHPEPIRFLHIDCDLYSSTRDVFVALEASGQLVPDLVICFDELINYNGYLWNEVLALHEMIERTGLGIEWIAAHDGVYSIEETLDMHESGNYLNWDERKTLGYREQAALILTPATNALPTPANVDELAERFNQLSKKRSLCRDS